MNDYEEWFEGGAWQAGSDTSVVKDAYVEIFVEMTCSGSFNCLFQAQAIIRIIYSY